MKKIQNTYLGYSYIVQQDIDPPNPVTEYFYPTPQEVNAYFDGNIFMVTIFDPEGEWIHEEHEIYFEPRYAVEAAIFKIRDLYSKARV